MKFILSVLYILYCFYFFLAVGINEFFSIFNWMIFAKLGLFIFPIYIYMFYRFEDSARKHDHYLIFFPAVVWFILVCLMGGKSAMNVFIVELPIVGILSGIYFFKFLIVRKNKPNSLRWGALISFVIIAIIISLHYMLPALPE